jgi:hypothetical protein
LSQGTEDKTVRRFRKAFLGLYLAFTIGMSVWTFLTLLASNCGGRAIPSKEPRISSKADDLFELRQCQRELERLLTDLHKETFNLQGKALRFDTDPGTEWRNWAAGWRQRWHALDWECRLSELSGKGVSAEIDAMESVHLELDELQHSYTGVVDTFVERYVERLHRLRGELNKIGSMIETRGREAHAPERPKAERTIKSGTGQPN